MDFTRFNFDDLEGVLPLDLCHEPGKAKGMGVFVHQQEYLGIIGFGEMGVQGPIGLFIKIYCVGRTYD
jgi:hypothetical protein